MVDDIESWGMDMRFFVLSTRVSMLVVMLASGGCSTERHARATQQTAIGGGFVAMGSVGLAGSAVSAAGVAVVAAANPDSAGLVRSSLLSIGVSAGVSAAIAGAGFYMMSTAEPDLFVGAAEDVRSTTSSHGAAESENVWGRGGPPKRPAERPARIRKSKSEPRQETDLKRISARLFLGLGNDSVVINLPQLPIDRDEECGQVTITQGKRSATALAYEPLQSSFRLSNGSISLTCDDFLPVLTACENAFELTGKECRSIQSAIERED